MSKVFFSDMRTGHKENLFDKIAKAADSGRAFPARLPRVT